MDNKSWFVDSGFIAQRSSDQGFEEIHYPQSMWLQKETFGPTAQINVEPIENIG